VAIESCKIRSAGATNLILIVSPREWFEGESRDRPLSQLHAGDTGAPQGGLPSYYFKSAQILTFSYDWEKINLGQISAAVFCL
jgi:hypothetical protein